MRTFVRDALRINSDAAAVSVSTRLKESRDGAEQYLAALEQAVYQALLVRTGRLDPDVLGRLSARLAKGGPVGPRRRTERPVERRISNQTA